MMNHTCEHDDLFFLFEMFGLLLLLILMSQAVLDLCSGAALPICSRLVVPFLASILPTVR
jgi:hypothetical protein